MTQSGKMGINQRGFTMIEIVVVLIILVIMSPFVITRVTADTNSLIAQAEVLKSHLRYAQIKAMNDTVPWGIRFSSSSTYILYRNNAQAASQLPGENGQTHTLPAAVTVTSGVGTTINFNDWGTPVNTGSPPVPMAATQTITLSQGAATSSITITKNTGYIP